MSGIPRVWRLTSNILNHLTTLQTSQNCIGVSTKRSCAAGCWPVSSFISNNSLFRRAKENAVANKNYFILIQSGCLLVSYFNQKSCWGWRGPKVITPPALLNSLTRVTAFIPALSMLNTSAHLLNLLIQHPEKFLLALRSVNAEKGGGGGRGSQRQGGGGGSQHIMRIFHYTPTLHKHSNTHTHSSQQCEKSTIVMLWRKWLFSSSL